MGVKSAAVEGDAEQPIPELVHQLAFLSVQEAATLLDVSERTIRRAIARGALPAVRQGRTLQIAPDALARFRARRGSLRHSRPASVAAHLAGPGPPALVSLPRKAPIRQAALPVPLTRLIGRRREVAAVADLLHGGRLVTLIGPGGVGKTRLALHAADEVAATFADGVAFVDLAPVRDPTHVLAAIAEAVGVQDLGLHPLRDTLISALGARDLLLVIDNFEHVLSAAPAIADLLRHCPRLRVLATSRSPLHVAGERQLPVLPLPIDETEDGSRGTGIGDPTAHLPSSPAVQLFVERSQAVTPDFYLTESNAAFIVQICRHLDGLPLAIELAAAWVRVLSPAALLERLDQRLPLLQGGAKDQPSRLRTMRDAVAWSYDLLTPEEARLFRRLAVFVGGFSLDAAEWIGDQRAETLNLLTGLVDKSLLLVHRDGIESRFLLLETVREFAMERLAEAGETAEAAARQASYMLALSEQAAPELLGPHEWHWMARFDTELGNLRAALTWALEHDMEIALRIGGALWPYWGWHQPAEGRRWLTAALARPASAPPLVRARALTVRAALVVLEADAAAGIEASTAAASLAQVARDAVVEGEARWLLGYAHFFTADLTPAAPELDRALELLTSATNSTDRGWAANAAWARGAVAFVLGEREQGLHFYEWAVAHARAAGSDLMTILILSDFAGWLFDLGERARARAMLRESLALAIDHDEFWFVSYPLIGLALVEAVAGDSAKAARSLGAVEALLTLSGQVEPPAFLWQRFERATALARHALRDPAFAAAWAIGNADPRGVISEALGQANASAATAINQGAVVADQLTPREQEVLRLVVAGQPDKAIAAALGISRRTASNHVASIRAKLDAPSRSVVVAIAMRDGLV